jgi:hypothetical protein
VAQVRTSVKSENKLDALLVPAVQMLRRGEVGVATQNNFAESCLLALVDRKIEQERRMLVTGAITRAIEQVQNFLRFSQRNDQRMVTHWPL